MEFCFNEEKISPKKAAELFYNSLAEQGKIKLKNMLQLSKKPAFNIAEYYKVDYDQFINELRCLL